MIPILLLCIAALAVLVANDLCNRAVKSIKVCTGTGMLPTLSDGNRCMSAGVGRFTRLRRGDIVSITRRADCTASLVKRIIATPGDTVLMSETSLWVNGVLLDERYLAPRSVPYTPGLVKLGADEYWVMGDNRDVAIDSRHFGPIKRTEINRKMLRDVNGLVAFSAGTSNCWCKQQKYGGKD